eukprot:gnl/MRDRNA2_/MRDRNA2_82612_c0_seq2.p1 gnl/MRDRNA2_/MRDRNA2_82612_c0~~gnl/MRDRNA2_/MRDRNA2_82612_c0_seq2.p1  ORF type:complete len:1192 (+),score=236.72 gnl/MRDRNA2_/MRDRNA2_82612_c0_seq2:323-3577(+)
MARIYPPILIASALASLPMVVATSYYVVHSLNDTLHGAQELQVSMELVNSNVQGASGGVDLVLATFDKDYDLHLSRTELEGLFRGLETIGFREVGEQVFFLADATGNRDGLLSADEIEQFVVLAKKVVSVAQLLASDDSAEGKRSKVLTLIGDDCMTPDTVTQVLGTAQMVMSPGTPPLIPEAQLRQAVIAADADHDGCLSPKELMGYLDHMKADLEAKKAQVQSMVGILSNPSPENLQGLAAQLTGLDLNKDGLDFRAGAQGLPPETQPLIGALSLVSPEAVTAMPKLIQASDANGDGLLSTNGITPLNTFIPGGSPGSLPAGQVSSGIPGKLPGYTTGGIPSASGVPAQDGQGDLDAAKAAAKTAAAMKAFDSITGKVEQDAQKAAVLAANLQKEVLAMKAAKMAMNPLPSAKGMPSLDSKQGFSLLQFETSMNSFVNSSLHETLSGARRYDEPAALPQYSLLQRMSGMTDLDLEAAQKERMQRMIHDNALIAIAALEQIAAGETLPREAAAGALLKIQRDSLSFLQQQKMSVPSEGMPKVQDSKQAPAPKSQAPQENAEIVAFVQQLAPYLQKSAAAARALLTSLADDEKAAQVIFKTYDSNNDRFISKDELAKAIGPAVAPLYPLVSARQLASAVILPGLVDADRDGRLAEIELQHVVQILSMGVARAFGDVNGDGNKDKKDLLAAADHFGSLGVTRQDNRKVHTNGISLLGVGMHRRTYIKKASLVTAAVRQKLGEVAASDGDVFPVWVTDYVSALDTVVEMLPVGRIKGCIIISGAMAFAFAIYILFTAFRGYHWMFVQMQSGQHQYPGNKDGALPEQLRNQYGNSTLFLGMLMSTMVCGWVFVFFLIFVVLSVLMFAELWIQLWQLRLFLLFLIATKLIIVFLRNVVIDEILNEKGFITWPMTFASVWVILMILNFAIGLLASICRFFILIPAILYRFNTLDDTMVPDKAVSMDPGYYSLLSLTYTSYEQMNPICRSFITTLNKSAHRLYGPAFLTSDEVRNWDEKEQGSSGQESAQRPMKSATEQVEPAPPEVVKRTHRRRVLRNKLWLAFLLEKNPGLMHHRSHRHKPEELHDFH